MSGGDSRGGLFFSWHAPGEVPEDALAFWRAWIAVSEPAVALTRSPEWFAMMAEGLGGAGAVAVCHRDSDRTVCAVLPVLFREWTLGANLAGRSLWRRALRMAKVCGGDLVGGGIEPGALAGLWTEFVARCPDTDGFWFDHVPCGPGEALLRASAGCGFFVHALYPPAPHYRIDLRKQDGDVERRRTKKTLDRLRSKERALAREVGPLRVVEVRSPDDWAPHAAVIETLMNNAWQARLLGHTLRMDDQRAVAERGWLRSFLLLAGERPAAFVLCYAGMNTLIYEQLGYDQALGRYSPGLLLLHRVIERLREPGGPAFLDFGEGEADYKRALANESVPVSGLLIVRSAPGRRAAFALARAAARVDTGLRRAIERSGLKRRLWRKLKGPA